MSINNNQNQIKDTDLILLLQTKMYINLLKPFFDKKSMKLRIEMGNMCHKVKRDNNLI